MKFNLMAVIVVMLAVLFLGAAAADWAGGVELLTCHGIALVILAVSEAVLIFQQVHSTRPATNRWPVITKLWWSIPKSQR